MAHGAAVTRHRLDEPARAALPGRPRRRRQRGRAVWESDPARGLREGKRKDRLVASLVRSSGPPSWVRVVICIGLGGREREKNTALHRSLLTRTSLIRGWCSTMQGPCYGAYPEEEEERH